MSDRMLPPEAPSYGDLLAEIERLRAAIDADTKYIALADEQIEQLREDVSTLRAADVRWEKMCELKAAEIERLRKQKQIAVDALFRICQSDWGIGHSLAKPAHKAIKALAALEGI